MMIFFISATSLGISRNGYIKLPPIHTIVVWRFPKTEFLTGSADPERIVDRSGLHCLPDSWYLRNGYIKTTVYLCGYCLEVTNIEIYSKWHMQTLRTWINLRSSLVYSPSTHTCCKNSRPCPTVSQYQLDVPDTRF